MPKGAREAIAKNQRASKRRGGQRIARKTERPGDITRNRLGGAEGSPAFGSTGRS